MKVPAECSPEQLERVLAQGSPLHFRDGQVLFYAGHFPTGVYHLQRGTVELQPEAPLLGLSALAHSAPFGYTCRAIGEVQVLFVPKASLYTALEINPNTSSRKKSARSHP